VTPTTGLVQWCDGQERLAISAVNPIRVKHKKENEMATTAIKPCTCTATKQDSAAEFQDQTYGKGQRVHIIVTTAKGTESRCTVCGAKK
jgi:hypothetical protein